MPFGQSQMGYCCAQSNMLPCNVNMMLCTTTGQSTVQQVYPCPFDANTCGAQTIDVPSGGGSFNVSSINNKTLCQYQFRDTNIDNMVINVKVQYSGNDL